MIISIKEARKILGKDYEHLSDEQIGNLIEDLDAIAVAALKDAREKQIKDDATAMAELVYDIYQDKKKLQRR
jgi:hypothetical protein